MKHPRRWWLSCVPLAIALAGGGCEGLGSDSDEALKIGYVSTRPGDGPATGEDAAPGKPRQPDPSPIAADAGAPPDPGPAAHDEDTTSAAPPIDAGAPPTPPKGAVGAACTTDAECASGVCGNTSQGAICLNFCPNCLAGWECHSMFVPATAETLYVCAPPGGTLDVSCGTDADCQVMNGAVATHHKPRCVQLGCGTGGRCGCDCEDSECPDGFSCQWAPSPDGAVRQCVRDTYLECLPSLFPDLCSLCNSDEDCAAGAGGRCIPSSYVNASFCGGDCFGGVPCPDGYSCEQVAIGGAGGISQCVPAGDALCTDM